LSSTGGPGSWFIRYGSGATPTRAVEFQAGETRSVSEHVDGLHPATTYTYEVCAEDGENPGDPFCSPAQLFRTTAPGGAFHVESRCEDAYPYEVHAFVTSYEPSTNFGITSIWPDGGHIGTVFTTNASGNAGIATVYGSEPLRVRVIIWLNPDDDFVQDPGEPTVHDEIWVVDEPCTDGHPE
jgi:hypothetical protein